MKRQILFVTILSVFFFSSFFCLADTVPVSLEYTAETYGYAHALTTIGGINDAHTDHDYSTNSQCHSSAGASAYFDVMVCPQSRGWHYSQTSNLQNSIEGNNEVNGISIISNIKGWGHWGFYDECAPDSSSRDDGGDGNGFTKMTGVIVINSGGAGILDVNARIIGDNPSSWDSWSWYLKIWKNDANNPIIVLNATHMSASLDYVAGQSFNFEFYHTGMKNYWPAPSGLDSTVKISINSNPFIADLDENWYVDFFDFAILANDWRLNGPNLDGDITRDFHVDFKDLLILADEWLDCLVKPANNPNPANGVTGRDPNTILKWTAGDGALEHDVYLGTDANAVTGANRSSAEFKDTISDVNFAPGSLNSSTTYYWRVDEIGPRCAAKGYVWNFKTGSEVIDPNLVGWWKFDEGSGTAANDSSGHNNNGTVNGSAAWTGGQINGALSFDGSDDYVAIPTFSVSTNNGAIGLWFETSADFTANYAGQGYLINKDSQSFSYLAVTGNGTVPYGINGETNVNNDYFVVINGVVPVGVWNHIFVSFSNKTAKTYLNGVLIQTLPVTNSSLILYRIGGRTQVFFHGKIDDVRIYNRALSGAEIQQIYLQGSTP